jgi:hypothetical protein
MTIYFLLKDLSIWKRSCWEAEAEAEAYGYHF